MNLTQITAHIGKTVTYKKQNEFSSLIKNITSIKEKEEPYIVSLVFDFKKKEINISLREKLSENSVDKYYYFGNNSAASFQYYLVRETKSLNYLLSSLWNDLYHMLVKYNLQNQELANIIKSLESNRLISLGEKKGEGKVNLSKMSIFKDKLDKDIVLGKKNIIIGDEKYNFDKLIRLFLDDDNKLNRYVLIIPTVRVEEDSEIILSTHHDYLELVKLANNLGNKDKQKGKERFCYVCKRKSTDVSSKYSKKFSRTGINKIFTTTTINTSPYLQNYNYDNSYAVCIDCYQNLLAGEKIISQQFKGKIAGEDVFIVPEGMLDNFDYNFMYKLKHDVDFAFKADYGDEWLSDLDYAALDDNVASYSINFIFYRTDGNSVTIMEAIEDIPAFRFIKVIKTLAKNVQNLKPHIISMTLGSIYSMIPVRVNKKGEQMDIGRIISLYKSILSNEKIESHILYTYAVEALDKGMKQLSKSKIDNYYNMRLTSYLNGKEDFFIKDLIMKYIILFKTGEELHILKGSCMRKEENSVDTLITSSEKINSSIMEIEKFLEHKTFCNKARALFYLGILINQVAFIQFKKEHKSKPILKKVQFQGMKDREIYALYHDVVEKLRQYEKLELFTESIMNRFHYYYGSLNHTQKLSEQANVFYIMAGYSYMVGRKFYNEFELEERYHEKEIL